MNTIGSAQHPARRWCTTSFLLLALCGGATAASAQTVPAGGRAEVQRTARGALEGRVLDASTGKALPYASVELPTLERSTVADAEGRFRVTGLPTGEYSMVVKLLGYSPFRAVTPTGTGEALEVRLEPDAVMLQGLTVTTNRLDQRARRYTGRIKVVDRDRIMGSAWGDARNIVVAQGVTPAPCRSRGMSGCIYRRGGVSSPSVYVDDFRMLDGLEALRTYSRDEVARIEVLDGGQRIHVYTEQFVERAARGGYRPLPYSVY